jgi:hypothetical protein
MIHPPTIGLLPEPPVLRALFHCSTGVLTAIAALPILRSDASYAVLPIRVTKGGGVP